MKSFALALGLIGALSVGNAHALKSDAEQPINIRAKHVDANEKTGVAIYRGNVVLTQGSLRLEAERMEVTTRDGRAQLLRAWGNPVRLRARSDKGEDLRAQANRTEYHASARRIDLYERVSLKRDADVVNSAVIHYQMENGTFTAEGGNDGQVTAVIQPAPKEKEKEKRP